MSASTSEDSASAPKVSWASAMMTGDGLEEAKTLMRIDLEAVCAALRDAILRVSPRNLLGFLWAQLLIYRMTEVKEGLDAPGTDPLADIVFALEYVHATLSATETSSPTSDGADELLNDVVTLAAQARQNALVYSLVVARMLPGDAFGDETGNLAVHAMTSWITIRGHRYQGLEAEFFRFILSVHDEALVRAYGVDSDAIAAGIQSAVDATRFGHMRAIETMKTEMDAVANIVTLTGVSMEEAVAAHQQADGTRALAASNAITSLFYGGLVNVTQASGLPTTLLDDLSYIRGEDKEFFADGDLKGTPLRTLPARVKPLVVLDGQHYACDPNFLRDSAYRAIQRGLRARLPDDGEGWKHRQTKITERAFASIFADQLQHAEVFETVYYQDVTTGAWVENDMLILLDDVMLQVEVKAGVMAMHSPELKFSSHVRAIRDLVVKARGQCDRFFRYAESAEEVPLYALRDGKYVAVRRLCLKDYRLVVPIGLTVEAFTPFSSMCKRLPSMTPILGRLPFVSMSIDDLFVLTRLLPSAGELTHYLAVRQALAGIPQVYLHDELDHLGAYIAQNRPDQTYLEQLARENADLLVVDGTSKIVDAYFGDPDWPTKPRPQQPYPPLLAALLESIGVARRHRYLAADSAIRNLDAKARSDAAETLEKLLPTLAKYPVRWFSLAAEPPLMFWLQRDDAGDHSAESREKAEAVASSLDASSCDVITIHVTRSGMLYGASFKSVAALLLKDERYAAVQEHAERLKAKHFIDIKKPS